MFYRSFRDAIRQLPKRQRLALYDAIADYALDGTVPELDNKMFSAFWSLMQPSIDRCKKTPRSCPARRGAPLGNLNAAKKKNNQLEERKEGTQGNVEEPTRSEEYASVLQKLKETSTDPPRLDREIAEISRDNAWVESVCVLFQLSPEQLTPYISCFRIECKASGILGHDGIPDCKNHFKSWLRLQIERKQKNEQSERHKILRRRADVPLASQTDYHSSF